MSEQKKESPVIVLPEDEALRKRLKLKLQEYKSHVNPCTDPKLQMSAICKLIILERLLREGRVKTWDISLEISEAFPGGYNSDAFNNACLVIEDYCLTGGENIVGGTGLSPADEACHKRLRPGYPPMGYKVKLIRDYRVNCIHVTPPAAEKIIINDTGVTKVLVGNHTYVNPVVPAGAIGIVGEGPFSGIIFDYNLECPVQFIYDPRIPRTVGVPWNILELAD